MPLFSFLCRSCECESEVLVRGGEQPVCAQCGGTDLEKLMSHFAPMQGGAAAPEPMGCGAQQCCRLQGGCMN